MSLNFQSQNTELNGIYQALFSAGEAIYAELKKGAGLKFAASGNESGDEQIELDIIADEAFFKTLSQDKYVRYVVSEERPGLSKLSDGPYSIALDPNIIAGGFFVFGMNLEAYFADGPDVYKGIFDQRD